MDRRLRTGNTDLPSPHANNCTGGRLVRVSVGWDKDRGWTHWGAWENRCRGGDSLEPRAGHRPIRPGSPQASSQGQPHLTPRPQLDPPFSRQGPSLPHPACSIHTSAHTPSSLLPAARQALPRHEGWTDGCMDGQGDRRLTFAKADSTGSNAWRPPRPRGHMVEAPVGDQRCFAKARSEDGLLAWRPSLARPRGPQAQGGQTRSSTARGTGILTSASH